MLDIHTAQRIKRNIRMMNLIRTDRLKDKLSLITLTIFFTGFIVDAGIFVSLYSSLPFWHTDFWFLSSGHCICAAMMAFVMRDMLPEKYSRKCSEGFIFFVSLGIFIPLVGVLGMIFVIYYGLYEHKKNPYQFSKLRSIPNAEMLDRPPDVGKNSANTNYSMLHRLNRMKKATEHVDIVLATRSMKDQNAVRLLDMALKSADDDVRLLAFSLLEKRNIEITKRICILEKIRNKSMKVKVVNVALADCYLNQVVSGLVKDEPKEQSLQKAEKYLKEALSEDPKYRSAYLTLGKVFIEQAEFNKAHSAFNIALQYGYAQSDVYPFLAKIAFKKRQFWKIPEFLIKIPEDISDYSPVAELNRYWLKSPVDSKNIICLDGNEISRKKMHQ
jgi:hypothetical protein